MTTYGDLPAELHQAISQAAFGNRTAIALRGLDRKTRTEPPASQPFLDRLAKLLALLKVTADDRLSLAVKVRTWDQEYRILYVRSGRYTITAESFLPRERAEISAEQVLTFMSHVSGNAHYITLLHWQEIYGYTAGPMSPTYKRPDFGLEYAAYLA